MIRQLIPVTALLLGSFFLLFAGGMNSLVLPLRGSQEGFSAWSLGLLGTGYAIGYVSGCILSPGLVGRVGHVRSFSVLCALASISVLGSYLLIEPAAWIMLRAITGFSFAGAAMIVESWLNESATVQTRGRIFGIYTMVNLVASTGGQLLLSQGDPGAATFFVLAAMFYSLALVPTAASSRSTPRPLVKVKLDMRSLWRNSPVAVFAVLMVGISNATFGTLSAVYAVRIGLPLDWVAAFASMGILAAALVQMPVGYLSDRMDRRKVLIGIVLVAIFVELAFVALQPTSVLANVGLAALLGASLYSMYPVLVSHANDHAEPGTGIQISGGLLMVYGLGAIAGPLISGYAMGEVGPRGLFVTSLSAHVLLIAYTLWRISRRDEVAQEEKQPFQSAPPAPSSTPQTAVLAADADAAEAVIEAEEASANGQDAPVK